MTFTRIQELCRSLRVNDTQSISSAAAGMIGLAAFEEKINDQHWRKLHTVQYTNEIMQNEISIHLDLGPEEVGRSLHVWPGLPRNVPQHDVTANVQLIPQGAVEVPNMTQILSKGIQTGRRLTQRVLFFRQEKGRGNLRNFF